MMRGFMSASRDDDSMEYNFCILFDVLISNYVEFSHWDIIVVQFKMLTNL